VLKNSNAGGQKQVDLITHSAFKEVSAQAEVAFQMRDSFRKRLVPFKRIAGILSVQAGFLKITTH